MGAKARNQEGRGFEKCQVVEGAEEALFNHVEMERTSGSINAHRLTHGVPDGGQLEKRRLRM